MSTECPLNVMHVNYSLEMGGAEIFILDVLRRVDRTRFRPMVCSFQKGGILKERFEALDIPVFEVVKRPGKDWRLYPKLARLFRAERVDIVHTHNFYMWLYGGPAARLVGARVVHTEHSNIPTNKRRLKWASRGLAQITARIIADSESVAAFMIGVTRLPSAKVSVVHNGIDIGRFEAPSRRRQCRESVNLQEDARVVGIVARLVPVKNHLVLLEAFRKIASQLPDARLLIVGDGELRAELVDRARALGLDGRVAFLGARHDVPDLLSAMDVFVLPSKSEGLSIALLEAMAAGVPVVATRVGGTPEVVVDGVTGLLVEANNVEQLADAIAQLLVTPALARRLAAQGRERVRGHFDLEKTVARYEGVYEQLASPSTNGGR